MVKCLSGSTKSVFTNYEAFQILCNIRMWVSNHQYFIACFFYHHSYLVNFCLCQSHEMMQCYIIFKKNISEEVGLDTQSFSRCNSLGEDSLRSMSRSIVYSNHHDVYKELVLHNNKHSRRYQTKSYFLAIEATQKYAFSWNFIPSPKALLMPSYSSSIKKFWFLMGQRAIDHTKSQVGYKSIVWFGASVRCATKLKLHKAHFPYTMDAEVLWPIGGLTSVRCAT